MFNGKHRTKGTAIYMYVYNSILTIISTDV